MGVNVAVTGLHAADNPAPGIGIIRCLRYDTGWDGEIIGLAYDALDTGIYDAGLLDHSFLIPYPNQDSKEILKRILYIHEQVRIDVLIPSLDSELSLYQKLESELKQAGIKMFIPSGEAVQKRSKKNLVEFCRDNDIPTPKTIVISDPNRFDDALEELGYPLYIKGVFYEAYRCTSRDEALQYLEKLRKMWGLPVLLQETIPGEEFDICAVGDREGNLLGAVPMRKLRLTDKGKAWAAITLRNPALLELSRKILKALKWAGPCELEIMQSSRTKEYYLIEINPRFPAWVYLSAGADQNLPRLLTDLALGKNPNPLPPARQGVAFVRHATDLLCPLDWVEQLTVGGELHYKLNEEMEDE